ncbi:Crp/Fnr family transcriptional regulator [Proteiniclasticum sp. C24MP]|uniref:Crp/Fnr family transcriptional regulator n=1 Tax=Proteiniclasticum sp. C24MP TaxID=3374101 RepID=UPI00375527E1
MKLNDYMEDLAQLPLFEDFRKYDLRNHLMERGTALHRYLKNEMIYLQGQTASKMDIVLSGKVSVQRLDENGNVLRIENFRKGSLIGANLIFSTFRTYPMTVIAEEESVLISLDAPLILHLCSINSNFMLKFLQAVSDRTLVLTNKIEEISPGTLRNKLLDYLTYEKKFQKRSTIVLDGTKKQLAERLGVQRTSLSRELQKMKRDGLIEYDRNTITLKD